jgi:hypothetical protein
MLIPPPQLGEDLWARIAGRWRKGRVVAIKPKTLHLALLRPMPDQPFRGIVSVGWNYIATEHELRRDPPAEKVAAEWGETVVGHPIRRTSAGSAS